jgi:hypothetical protein
MRVHRVTDRSVVAVLTLLGAFGVSVALADPPAAPTTPAATAPAASTTSAPASSAPPAPAAAAPVKETDSQLEKRLTNSGYKARMRNGTKVWCKRQGELGSRLGGQEVCGTPEELKLVVQQNQDAMKDIQKLYNHSPN